METFDGIVFSRTTKTAYNEGGINSRTTKTAYKQGWVNSSGNNNNPPVVNRPNSGQVFPRGV